MKIEKIYQVSSDKESGVIFQLADGLKIIKRSDETVEKFDINRWEVISFIPEDFQQVERQITPEEERELEKFLIQNINSSSKGKKNSIWNRIKKFWENIFK